MYRRFLNDNDYMGIIASDSLSQMVRGNNERYIQAEESAEMSILEYLSENYEIEKELHKGKYIAEYDRRIAFPVGVHLYLDGKIYEVIRSISGYKAPSDIAYWSEYSDVNIEVTSMSSYSQFSTYYVGDVVQFNGVGYSCLSENGYKFGDIRIPMVNGWLEAETSEWQPIEYPLWSVVSYNNEFYTLLDIENFDNNKTPFDSECWGAIADYDRECNEYDLSEREYVVYNGKVFYPEVDVNADLPEIGKRLALGDPRNDNLKKHMTRLAVYELTKLIAPNNVSIVRVRDYEDSMKWLSDASKLKLNPQISRKLGEDKKPVTDWQLATFQTSYDPYQNPWMI